MTDSEKTAMRPAVEAMLFAMGRSVAEKDLAEALGIPEAELAELIAEMAEEYEKPERGIRLIRLEDHYQLCTKKEYYDVLVRLAAQPSKPVLTEVMMEVLSIIAYKQPVTRAEIERIRGVNSDYSVNRLVEFGLAEEAGRLDAPGRPILFRTTEEFLRRFGIASSGELPEVSEAVMEEAREEVLADGSFDDLFAAAAAENEAAAEGENMPENESSAGNNDTSGSDEFAENKEFAENAVSTENEEVKRNEDISENAGDGGKEN